MSELIIHRDYVSSECVQGRLYLGAQFVAHTIERPWLDNQNDISCVPDGVYDVVVHDSSKYGPILALVNPDLDVYYRASDRPGGEGRFLCLVAHVGNWAKNVKGCVAVGMTRSHEMVGKSRDAVRHYNDTVDINMVTKVTIISNRGIHL